MFIFCASCCCRVAREGVEKFESSLAVEAKRKEGPNAVKVKDSNHETVPEPIPKAFQVSEVEEVKESKTLTKIKIQKSKAFKEIEVQESETLTKISVKKSPTFAKIEVSG